MVLLATIISFIISLISCIVSIFMAVEGLWIVLVVLAIVTFILNRIKNSCKPEEEKEKPIENEPDYRYKLINISTKQIVGGSNDYQEAFKLKRRLGNGIMIKDTQKWRIWYNITIKGGIISWL